METRVLMVQPPAGGYGLTNLAVVEPLGLECVMGGIRDTCKVDLLDMRFDKDIKRSVTRFSPDVVGVTASTTEVNNAHKILKRVKEIQPHSLTVVGGFHPSLRPQDFQAGYIDVVVRGEGELTFRECIQRYIDGENFKGILGVSYYDKSCNRLLHNTDRPLVEDLDKLPEPYREPVEKYRKKYNFIFWQPVTSLETTRGCPYRCTFCVVWKFYRGKYRTKSPMKVISELEMIREKHILIIDVNFLQDIRRAEKICEKIIERGISKKFGIQARADSIARNPSIAKTLADMGVGFALIGFEATSDSQLKAIRKRSTAQDNEATIKLLHEHGIKIMGAFIVDPNYTKEDFEALLDYVIKYEIEFPQFTVLTPLPESDLFYTRREELITSDWERYDTLRTVLPTKLPLHIFNMEMKNLYRRTYLKPKSILKRIFNKDYPLRKLPGFLKMLSSLKT